MTPFEDELKKALARCEPPDGFTERLAARISALPRRRSSSLNSVVWRWAAIAAAVLVLLSGAVFQREHEREIKGEEAKQQLLVALRITSSKLQQAQQQIREVEREGTNQ
jgi:hypothetical protein